MLLRVVLEWTSVRRFGVLHFTQGLGRFRVSGLRRFGAYGAQELELRDFRLGCQQFLLYLNPGNGKGLHRFRTSFS